MDRSTIIGFLLIAGLLFGYSWLKQPSEEEIAQARIAEAQAKVEQKATDIQPVVVEEPMDSLAQEAKIKSQYGAFASLTNGESEKITLETLSRIFALSALMSIEYASAKESAAAVAISAMQSTISPASFT